jgi:benzoyl-CoA-dihydrodiol lyase
MLAMPEDDAGAPIIATSMMNFGAFPMINKLTRVQTRFCSDGGPIEKVFNQLGEPFKAAEAARLGLVTFTPDDLDWEDEVRIALEERASLSPDALTGMEANLRFTGAETMETRIFGRLSAWQNWIFSRPNAVGERGALKVFGAGSKPDFDRERI